jgi:hypothetical protein
MPQQAHQRATLMSGCPDLPLLDTSRTSVDPAGAQRRSVLLARSLRSVDGLRVGVTGNTGKHVVRRSQLARGVVGLPDRGRLGELTMQAQRLAVGVPQPCSRRPRFDQRRTGDLNGVVPQHDQPGSDQPVDNDAGIGEVQLAPPHAPPGVRNAIAQGHHPQEDFVSGVPVTVVQLRVEPLVDLLGGPRDRTRHPTVASYPATVRTTLARCRHVPSRELGSRCGR